MLTLEQVKLLESKVESLIEMVKSLCAERDELKVAIQKKDERIEYLNSKVSTYETEQEKIEERVVNALNQLDVFQSSVVHAKAILAQSANLPQTLNSNYDSQLSSSEPNETNQNTMDSESSTEVESNGESHSDESDDSDKQMDIF